jgi:hypothetical protein
MPVTSPALAKAITGIRGFDELSGLGLPRRCTLDGFRRHRCAAGAAAEPGNCVIRLDRRLEEGVPVRRLEITKYRGSNFTILNRRGLQAIACCCYQRVRIGRPKGRSDRT